MQLNGGALAQDVQCSKLLFLFLNILCVFLYYIYTYIHILYVCIYIYMVCMSVYIFACTWTHVCAVAHARARGDMLNGLFSHSPPCSLR